jgi:glutaredoxin
MRYVFWIAAVLGLLAVQHRADIRNWFDPPPPVAVPASFQAVLYATDWCGYCAKTRAFFQENNIAFREYDIEKSAEAHAEYRRLGGQGVPVVRIAGDVIHGYNVVAIRAALAKLRTPSPAQ